MKRRSMALATGLVVGRCRLHEQPAAAGVCLSSAVDRPATETPVSLERSGLQLQRVLVPDYLDTTDILLRVGTHELHESTSGRWGERLSLGITRALRADLVGQLTLDVASALEPGANLARQILVNVDVFDVWK